MEQQDGRVCVCGFGGQLPGSCVVEGAREMELNQMSARCLEGEPAQPLVYLSNMFPLKNTKCCREGSGRQKNFFLCGHVKHILFIAIFQLNKNKKLKRIEMIDSGNKILKKIK